MKNGSLAHVDIHTLDNNDSLEASELRSSLIFGHKKIRDSRDAIMMKAVYSIVLYQDENNRSIREIIESYSEKLCQEGDSIDPDQMKSILNKLVGEKLINIENDQVVVKESVNVEKFINNVNEKTEALIEGIITQTQRLYGRFIDQKVKDKLTSNIKMALSVYFKLAGFEYFGKAVKTNDNETEDAVFVAMQNIGDKQLCNALIGALADTIHSKEDETREILEIWAKAYMSTQVMNLDPSLRQFKLKQLKGKMFVLDTDFVLNCLTKKSRYSEVYGKVLNTLVSNNCQCEVRIPKEVVEEVNNHARLALFIYKQYGEGVLELPDEFLETQLSNVFIEDYVKIKRSNSEFNDLTFDSYLKNIVYPKRPSFLEKKIESISPKIKMGLEKTDYKVEDDPRLQELKDSIFQDICKSERGGKRDDKVNKQISQTDATLYLSVYKKDEGLEERYALSKKAYLLSRSTRPMRCAKRLNYENCDVICKPQTLIAVFSEIGMVNTENTSVINLFENPFLTYTAHRIWPDVEGLMNVGADIKYSDIQRLRYEYEYEVNDVLTASTSDDFDNEIRKWRAKDYNWAKNTGELLDKIQSLKQQLAQKDDIIEAKNEENEKLKRRKQFVDPKDIAKGKKNNHKRSNGRRKR